MSTPATPTSPNTLWQTIETDLRAGASWFEEEASNVGLFVWNTLKGAFVALEPAVAQLVMDILSGAVAEAAGGKSIEQIESDALNSATTEGKAALAAAGSGVVQTLIAGLKANQPPLAS